MKCSVSVPSSLDHAPASIVCACCGAALCAPHAATLVTEGAVKPCPRCSVSWTADVQEILTVQLIVAEVIRTPDLFARSAHPLRDFLNLARKELGTDLINATCRRAVKLSKRRALEVAAAKTTHREHLAGTLGIGTV